MANPENPIATIRSWIGSRFFINQKKKVLSKQRLKFRWVHFRFFSLFV